jgi:hypothetical protein
MAARDVFELRHGFASRPGRLHTLLDKARPDFTDRAFYYPGSGNRLRQRSAARFLRPAGPTADRAAVEPRPGVSSCGRTRPIAGIRGSEVRAGTPRRPPGS